MGADVSDLRKLELDLAAVPERVRPLISRAIARTAFAIEADAKIMAPVDTGNLRNSISTDVDGLRAEVGPTADYALYVEEGTSRQAPQPFLGPAYDRQTPGLVEAVRRAGGINL